MYLRDDDEVEVRHVQPYEAVKFYRCPGCDHEIEPGLGHKVVVPVDASDLRRHWHVGCWMQQERRRTKAQATAAARKRVKKATGRSV